MSALHPNNFFALEHYDHAELFKDCEYVWQALPKIETYLQSHDFHIDIEIPNGVHLKNKHQITIGKGTVLEPGAYIVGPCIIGKNCEIRKNAYIRGKFICGDGCVVGCEVKGAIFLNEAKAAHYNYIGDSILGNKVNLGAGTKTANLRFDKRPVRVRCGDGYVDTELKKFGAIFGDLSQSGCNSVTNPGTLLAKGATILSCASANGFIDAQ
ncbi:MAG: UDP-N-acetylglucosamine diphosphorylase [Chlamydiota bacterium]|nr:UDP-N-acetylglucosamine diphosphorylase [Chlamydiota bacterium]